MDLTEEQDDFIYDLEREFPVTFKGNWKGGKLTADRNATITRDMLNDIVDTFNAYGFGISVYSQDEYEIVFDFDNYHGESVGYGY